MFNPDVRVCVALSAFYLLAGGGALVTADIVAADSSSSSPRNVHQDGPIINAECATPLSLQPLSQGVPIPKLQGSSNKPNIIVILTDDQGWDDIGLHNPKYIQTPNIDRFIQQSTMFDNFYVQPECAQSRAELLTGRSFPRTSTMLVHGGYDFISRAEVTAGKFMSDAGYLTAQIGKWHEYDVAGYGPADAGFEVTWHTKDTSVDATSARCFMSHNGKYVGTAAAAVSDSSLPFQAKSTPRPAPSNKASTVETVLMDKLLQFLRKYQSDHQQGTESRPLFVYYPPHMIHKKQGLAHGRLRPYPSFDRDRFLNNASYAGVPLDTIDAWANLAYMDDLFGRLFGVLDSTGLSDNTYVFLLSDNGAYLTNAELAQGRQYRMPSQMQGYKSSSFEGGIRNFLAVRGPGVPGGVTDSTLLQITDILPTIADLAGVPPNNNHLPWDGISFKNLVLPASGVAPDPTTTGSRGTTLAKQVQVDRFVFTLGPACWDADAVPELGPDREVVRPQTLLDYDQGGMLNHIYGKLWWLQAQSAHPISNNPGFEVCIAVRFKDYKWVGLNNKVYRMVGDDHVELPCNEVTGNEATQAAATASQAARQWWASLVAEPHSFVKPTFYLGLPGWTVSNVNAEGAHERTKGNIVLIPNGATGFQDVGDRLCYRMQVVTAASYDVIVMYRSQTAATFKLSLGPYNKIVAGTAPSLTAQLPPSSQLRGWNMGQFTEISTTKDNVKTELCFELISTPTPGQQVFQNLAVFRFIQQSTNTSTTVQSIATSTTTTSSSSLITQEAGVADEVATSSSSVNAGVTAASSTGGQAQRSAIATPTAEPDVSGLYPGQQGPSITATAAAAGTASAAAAGRWAATRAACGWPAGQGVLEHLYTPYVEDMRGCQACQPVL